MPAIFDQQTGAVRVTIVDEFNAHIRVRGHVLSLPLAEVRNLAELLIATTLERPAVPSMHAETVMSRLTEAGRTLMSLPPSQAKAKLTSTFGGALPADSPRLQAGPPEPQDIDAMDEALAWLRLIPQDRYVIRRIVGAKALVCPLTGKQLYSWRRLGDALGADHKAVQRWHAQGIDMIVDALAQRQVAA